MALASFVGLGWASYCGRLRHGSRRLTSWASALVALLAVLATAGAANAQAPAGPEDPNLLISEGILLRKQNDNEGAAKLFSRAYQMTKSPRAAAHLGTAEYSLLRWLDAEAHLAEALRARNDPWIEQRRTDIKKALDEVRSQLGWLEVIGRPIGAEVEVDGRTVGRLPLREPLRREAGEVYLKVTADGFEGYRRPVVIPHGQSARVVIDLEKIEAPPVLGGRRPVAEAPTGPLPPIDVQTSVPHKDSWRWPAAWVSAGFATLLTAAGIWGALVHSSKVSEFDSLKKPGEPNMFRCSTAFADSGGKECVTLLAEANQAQTIAVGSFIGGGAALVLSTVLFATAPSAAERLATRPASKSVALACLPVIGGASAGASCQLRF